MLSTPQNPLLTIEREYGQSIWMDNLSRDLLASGELAELINTRGVLGITSNPAIFEKAIAGNAIYDAQIVEGVKAGKSLNEIFESLIFTDIRQACDVLCRWLCQYRSTTLASIGYRDNDRGSASLLCGDRSSECDD
jgi:transaldolase